MGVAAKDLAGNWTVEIEPTVPNGATGQNEVGQIQRLSVDISYDPAPVVLAGSAFANLGDMTVGDFGGNPAI